MGDIDAGVHVRDHDPLAPVSEIPQRRRVGQGHVRLGGRRCGRGRSLRGRHHEVGTDLAHSLMDRELADNRGGGGLQPWPLPKTYAVLGLVAATTGLALAWHVKNGVIGWEETAEIPLMALLFLVMVWHVRRRVAATREARRYADNEHEMREVQKRFVRFASHELRTPVTVGRGFAELIRDARPGSQAAQDASVVLEEFDNLERIAARLLTLARMDEHSSVKPSVLPVSALLERTVTRWRPAANRDWRVSAASAVVVADSQRLETALDSLVENAVRYTDEGGVIELAVYPDEETVVIEVRDDGPGIPDEELGYIFESFRSGSSRGGTGIGLAIVKSILEAHGGAVSAENLPGGGASFRLRLPAHGPLPPAAEQDELRPRRRGNRLTPVKALGPSAC
jgi:two-component system OmpR family sensor kinase